jgi:hypothetical protein
MNDPIASHSSLIAAARSFQDQDNLELWTSDGLHAGHDAPKIRRLPKSCVSVVTVEDAARLVARHCHGHALRHTGVYHVPDGRPPEVVAQHPRTGGLLAGLHPGLPEVPAALADPPTAADRAVGLNDFFDEPSPRSNLY